MSDDSHIAEARLAYIPAAMTGIETRQGLDAANATPSSISPSTGSFHRMLPCYCVSFLEKCNVV